MSYRTICRSLSLVSALLLGTAAETYAGAEAVRDPSAKTLRCVRPSPYVGNLWQPARSPRRGVTAYDPERAYPGLTLYTSGEGATGMLVAMDGRVAYRWSRPYSTVWDESAAVRKPWADCHIYFRKAYVYPNGDLLAIYIGSGDTPWGYGMVRLDRRSEVVWKYLERTHHDFDVLEDGRIYALVHEFTHRSDFGHLRRPFLEDFLVVLSPEGRELKRISLFEAVARSRYRRLLDRIPHLMIGDPLHTNAVDVIRPAQAAKLGFAKAGQVLLSFRDLATGTIAVLDVDREEIVWATRGSWLSQHDPDVLPNGNMMLFDNIGHFGKGRSRILEFDPSSMEIEWSYAGDEHNPLDSLIRSAQQPLPNGNVLITESDGGRLLEVSRDGDIVWEFVNPVRVRAKRAGKVRDLIPVVSWAERVPVDGLTPDFIAAIEKKSGTKVAHLSSGVTAPASASGDGRRPLIHLKKRQKHLTLGPRPGNYLSAGPGIWSARTVSQNDLAPEEPSP